MAGDSNLDADFQDLRAVFVYFGGTHAGDFLQLIRGRRAYVSYGVQGLVVQDDEGRHAYLLRNGGAPTFEGLFQLLGCWG